MAADPDILNAIHTLGENLRNAVDARLTAHKDEADRARQRIYDRIDTHAHEARKQQAESTAELRGAIVSLGTQVTDLSARFGAHEKIDEREFERVDEEIKSASSKRHGYFQALVAAVLGAVAGWASRIFGGEQ